MAKKRVTVVVDANRWAAPMKETTESALLTDSKRMCCLGFCARVAGYDANEIRGVALPFDLDDQDRFVVMFPQLGMDQQYELADINDDFSQSKADRAQAITKLGKKYGVDFQFVNL